jgi:hypothetical protein
MCSDFIGHLMNMGVSFMHQFYLLQQIRVSSRSELFFYILVHPYFYILTCCNCMFSPFKFLPRLWVKYKLQNVVFVKHCFVEFKDMSVLKLQRVQICNKNHLPASQLLFSHSPANFRKTTKANL